MTDRAIRRAAERKSLKAARKAQRLNPPSESDPVGVDSPTPSEAQLAANRANAQLSTGAATPEGKAISSRNHTTHGLTAIPCENFKVLANENQSAYDQSLTDYCKEWNPTTATEHELIIRLATHAWLGKRAVRLQNEILAEVGDLIAIEDRRDFSLYMRYHNTHTRAFSKALSEIMRLRNFQMNQRKNEAILARRALDAQIRFESQKQKTELHAAKMETLRLKHEAIKQRHPKRPVSEQPQTQEANTKITEPLSAAA